MEHWPWWAGGLGLAAVALGHWLLARRMLSVSGRITAIVDRLRHGPPEEPDMSREEMLAALREMTAEEYGQDAVEAAPEPPAAKTPARSRASIGGHFVFLGGLAVGGVVSAALAGALEPVAGLRSDVFESLFGGGLVGPLVLVAGGVLVGFGTRMATGCTSGHGLCGASRLQPGSLVATCAFFGTGVVVSLLLGVLA